MDSSAFVKEFIVTRNRVWTDEEVAYLVDNYEYNSINSIASHLNRSCSAVKNKAWCLKLKNAVPGKYIKHSISYIRSEFEKDNYQLITDEYVGNRHKLDYICPNGHKHHIKWNDWQQGYRCPYCSRKKNNIELIKLEFENEGYILLTDRYINNRQKLDVICPNGHKFSITWGDWARGIRCVLCHNNSRKLNFDYIKATFASENYKVISRKYINANTKLKYVCPNGHINEISWNKWTYGRRCPTCRDLNRSGSGNPNWRGGISCEPYCDIWLDKEFKEDIKKRDNYKCQNPDCWGTSGRLVIHHIDYNKKNCSPNNLITLCNSCNSRANKDRDLHKQLYKKQVKLLME
jgi:hypothetical protein